MLYDFTNPPGAVSEILVKVAVCVWFQFGRVGAHRYVNVIFSFSSPAAAHRTNTTAYDKFSLSRSFFLPFFLIVLSLSSITTFSAIYAITARLVSSDQ